MGCGYIPRSTGAELHGWWLESGAIHSRQAVDNAHTAEVRGTAGVGIGVYKSRGQASGGGEEAPGDEGAVSFLR